MTGSRPAGWFIRVLLYAEWVILVTFVTLVIAISV